MKVPFPYQQEGIVFLSERKTALLADEMGLGKTVQAAHAAMRIRAAHIVVVCPAIARKVWSDEFKDARWCYRVSVCYSAHDVMACNRYNDPQLVIISYDLVKHLDMLNKTYDLLIIDEAHYLKSLNATRTKNIYGRGARRIDGLASRCKRIWALTGTPVPNNPSELYTHLRALDPKRILNKQGMASDYNSFVRRFCTVVETPYGQKITGGRNIEELRARLKGFMLRRRTSEVLKDLPELLHINLKLAVPASEAKAVFDSKDWIDMFDEFGELVDDTKFLESLKLKNPHIASLRRATGLLKVEPAIEWIEDKLDNGMEKLIVFAYHTAVIDTLYRSVLEKYPTVVVQGDTSPTKREQAVKEFQTGAARVFIGQLQAAGTALTLTASRDVLLLEQDWVPATMAQAIKRAHRIGQPSAVRVYWAAIENSVDENLSDAIRSKTETITSILEP